MRTFFPFCGPDFELVSWNEERFPPLRLPCKMASSDDKSCFLMNSNIPSAHRENHRSHDSPHWLERIRNLAVEIGWELTNLREEVNGLPVLLLDGGVRSQNIYLSAGVHGDEPAGMMALVEWGEENPDWFRRRGGLLIPCFNPDGILANTRVNESNEDLNRQFHRKDHQLIGRWHEILMGRKFDLAISLHEDFDATGMYLYELLQSLAGDALGEKVLAACADLIPPDLREEIDASAASAGVIRREIDPEEFSTIGFPEAVWLHLHHSAHTFTIESPSEFALWDRVGAHRRALDLLLHSR